MSTNLNQLPVIDPEKWRYDDHRTIFKTWSLEFHLLIYRLSYNKLFYLSLHTKGEQEIERMGSTLRSSRTSSLHIVPWPDHSGQEGATSRLTNHSARLPSPSVTPTAT